MALRELFPSGDPVPPPMPRSMYLFVQAVAVIAGTVVMLLRVAGIPAWEGIYGEDIRFFLPEALNHPWHLLTPFGGYVELLPRMLAQAAALLPLQDAAALFAISAAVIASLCALFVFHASAGYIRAPWLRVMLALAIVLLPVAPLEIPDSAVNAPWYLLFALFWAILWRPRSRAGLAIAAVIGFMTVSSAVIALVFLPLLVARVIALPRWREQAVTVGFAVGLLLVQLPYVVQGLTGNSARVRHLAPIDKSVSFYGHDVVLPALGWHLSWWLRDSTGVDVGMLVIGGFLAIIFGWALLTQGRPVRIFVPVALLTGFTFAVVTSTVRWAVTVHPVTLGYEAGSRYTDLPIFLIAAAMIVAVDSWLRRTRIRWRAVGASLALVVVLGVGWVTDFRYYGNRSNASYWPSASALILHRCQESPTGVLGMIKLQHARIRQLSCANIHG